MASYAWRRVIRDDGPHIVLQLFAGPDPDHRALSGELVLRREDEPEWFLELLPGIRLPTLDTRHLRSKIPPAPVYPKTSHSHRLDEETDPQCPTCGDSLDWCPATSLARHLISEHTDALAARRSMQENIEVHVHEHTGPGTIRNHPPTLFHWDPEKIRLVLAEDQAAAAGVSGDEGGWKDPHPDDEDPDAAYADEDTERGRDGRR